MWNTIAMSFLCFWMITWVLAAKVVSPAGALTPSLRATEASVVYFQEEPSHDLNSLIFQPLQHTKVEEGLFSCVYQSINAVPNRAVSTHSMHVIPFYHFPMQSEGILKEEHEWIITAQSHHQACTPQVLLQGKSIERSKSKPYQAYVIFSELASVESVSPYLRWRIRYTLTYQLHASIPNEFEPLPVDSLDLWSPEQDRSKVNSFLGFAFHVKNCLASYDGFKVVRYQTNECVTSSNVHLLNLASNAKSVSRHPRETAEKVRALHFTYAHTQAVLEPSLRPTGVTKSYNSASFPVVTKDLNSLTFQPTQLVRLDEKLYFCEYVSACSVINGAVTLHQKHVAPLYRFQIRSAAIVKEEHEWLIHVHEQKNCEPQVLFHGKRIGSSRPKPFQAYVLSSDVSLHPSSTHSLRLWQVRYTLTYQLNAKVPNRYELLPDEYLTTFLPENSRPETSSFIGLAFQFKKCLISYKRVKVARYQTEECVGPQHLFMMELDTMALQTRSKKRKHMSRATSTLPTEEEHVHQLNQAHAQMNRFAQVGVDTSSGEIMGMNDVFPQSRASESIETIQQNTFLEGVESRHPFARNTNETWVPPPSVGHSLESFLLGPNSDVNAPQQPNDEDFYSSIIGRFWAKDGYGDHNGDNDKEGNVDVDTAAALNEDEMTQFFEALIDMSDSDAPMVPSTESEARLHDPSSLERNNALI